MYKGKAKIYKQGIFFNDWESVFTLLYYPLIDKNAFILYHTLYSLSSQREEWIQIEQLYLFSLLKEKRFEDARQVLEEFSLLQTYCDAINHTYIFDLYPPKSANQFLVDNTLGRLAMNVLGSKKYEELSRFFAQQEEQKNEMVNISKSFDASRLQSWNDDKEALLSSIRPKEENQGVIKPFDFETFFSGMHRVFPPRLRSKQNLDLIANLANMYGIEAKEMKKYVQRSINPNTKEFSGQTLEKLVHQAKPPISKTTDLYSMAPMQFLQSKQNGPLARADEKLIQELCNEYEFPYDVVNILVEYVLEQTNQKFQRSYVEKVASAWSRLHIDTREKALSEIQNQPIIAERATTQDLPNWYANKPNTPIQENTRQQLKERMKRIGKE